MKQALNISDSTKNILLIAAGLILVLYAVGVFTCTFRILVILIGAAMFAAGFIRGGYWDKVVKLIKK